MDALPSNQELLRTCVVTTEPKKVTVLNYICKVILANEPHYKIVENATGVPWPVIAAIHFRESSLNFKTHLHNGDPLTDWTVHVPKGRPKQGTPPFFWADSAVDALGGLMIPRVWDLSGCAEFLERYNGLGYRKRELCSPYVWNFTNHYTIGLFVADGKFDPFKREARPGCISILKALEQKGVSLDFTRLDTIALH